MRNTIISVIAFLGLFGFVFYANNSLNELCYDIIESNLTGLDKLLDFYMEQRDKMEPLPKLLDGNEIMSILNIKPSKDLGKIIKMLEEAQLNDEIKTKSEAIFYIQNLYKFIK